jgi:5-methylthioadenosine/S-adenosylhomocysteine deaminase
MVLKGCTAAYDLYYEFPMPTQEGMDAVAEAYADGRHARRHRAHGRRPHDLRGDPGPDDALPGPLQAAVDKLRLQAARGDARPPCEAC